MGVLISRAGDWAWRVRASRKAKERMGGILSRFGVGYSGGIVTVAEEYMPLTLYVPEITDGQFQEPKFRHPDLYGN